MTDRDVYLTPEGARKLRQELDNLIQVERVELAVRLRTAIQMGDLSENADYHSAKQQQGFLEGRIQELTDTLHRAIIIDADANDTSEVRLGHVVTILADGEDDPEEYRIVGSTEANPIKRRISNESPIGKALLGRKVGDTITVETPSGSIEFKILKIEASGS